MSVKNFKEKGFDYERKLARTISLWYCNDPRALWRNTTSGGRATVVGNVYGGDIVPVSDKAKQWNLCIELKKSEGWNVEAFLQGNPGNLLLTHMLQCLSASQVGCNKIPILICKKNYQKALCFLYPHVNVDRKGKQFLARLKWPHLIPRKLLKQYPWDGPIDFFCLHLDTFFATFGPKDFLP